MENQLEVEDMAGRKILFGGKKRYGGKKDILRYGGKKDLLRYGGKKDRSNVL